MKIYSSFFILLLTGIPAVSFSQIRNSDLNSPAKFIIEQYVSDEIKKQKEDAVPDTALKTEKDAVAFAESFLLANYDKEKVLHERTYKAKRENGFWIVRGTLKASKGGVWVIRINPLTREITEIHHGK